MASGVLVACIGSATRLIDYVQRMKKRYTGTFLLGRHSPTEDTDGEVTKLVDPLIPTREAILAATVPLTGRIDQRPPAFSALKVAGRRAYDLARKGELVELASRPVDVYRLELLSYDYPMLEIEVECGSGTYIRSLGRDLARSLGTEAVMSALTRTAIGDFALVDAVDPMTLDNDSLERHLLPSLRAVAGLPRVVLSSAELTEVGHGRTIPYRRPDDAAEAVSGDEIAALDAQGRLAAILEVRQEGVLAVVRNFCSDGC
ncbi:MAG TPA: tRNA pseudouridine(55) synthase TruB [Planctomycetaceae bacterium]|nr:tRNA pseudouridine(55) synthase TruB [Planctomycetaceae bacterium]